MYMSWTAKPGEKNRRCYTLPENSASLDSFSCKIPEEQPTVTSQPSSETIIRKVRFPTAAYVFLSQEFVDRKNISVVVPDNGERISTDKKKSGWSNSATHTVARSKIADPRALPLICCSSTVTSNTEAKFAFEGSFLESA